MFYKDVSVQLKKDAKTFPVAEHAPDYSIFVPPGRNGTPKYEDRANTVSMFVPLKPQEGFALAYEAHHVDPMPDHFVFRLIVEDGEKAALWSTGARQAYRGCHSRCANSIYLPVILPSSQMTLKKKISAAFGKKHTIFTYSLIELEIYRVIKDPYEQYELHDEDTVELPYATFRFFCFDPEHFSQICPMFSGTGRRHSLEAEGYFASCRNRAPTPFERPDKHSLLKKAKSALSLRHGKA